MRGRVLPRLTSPPGRVAPDVVDVHADRSDRYHRPLDRLVKFVACARAVHVFDCAVEHLVRVAGDAGEVLKLLRVKRFACHSGMVRCDPPARMGMLAKSVES